MTDLAENRSAVIKAFSNIEPETKSALMSGVKFFLGEGKNAVSESIRDMLKKKPESDESDAVEPAVTQTKKVVKKIKKVPVRRVTAKKKYHSAVSRMRNDALIKAKKIIKK